MSCRVHPKTKSVEKGEELQKIARYPNFGSDLQTTFNNMQRRRRLNSRSLKETAATITTEASQTYGISAVETTSASGGQSSTVKTRGNGNADDKKKDDMADEDLLSGAGRPICSLGIFLISLIINTV